MDSQPQYLDDYCVCYGHWAVNLLKHTQVIEAF